jgi:hypothetical protein
MFNFQLMAGRLAPASEVAGGHTLPFIKGHGPPILKWYSMSSCGLLLAPKPETLWGTLYRHRD